MNDIIPFGPRPHVIITSALVTATLTTDASETVRVDHDPPRKTYFLDLVDADGSMCVWDGRSYYDAIIAAQAWVDDGVELHDRTDERRGCV